MRSFGPELRTLAAPLRRVAGAFARDAGGNVATVFAMLFIPVSILVFGSIELYRTEGVKTNLQDSLDAATLTAARTQTQNAARIQQVGMAALQASLTRHTDASLVTDPAQTYFRLQDGRVIARAVTEVRPIIAGHFMPSPIRTVADSEVVRGATRVEVAMVLDVTGSMLETSGGVSKLQRLRTAGQDLVTALETSAVNSGDPNNVRISLVPFASSVNVGAAQRTATGSANWLVNATNHAVSNQLFTTTSGGATTANRFTFFDRMRRTWGGCVETRPAPFDVTDAAASPSVPDSMFVPYFAPDEPGAGDGYTQTDANNDFDYINDYLPDNVASNATNQIKQRNTAKYVDARQPTNASVWSGLTVGPNFGCVASPIMPLSSNFGALRTAIGNLQASGDTNIPIGMAWGWQTLSPTSPLGGVGASYSDPDVRKVVILMTDGNNTNLQLSTSSNWNGSIYSGLAYIHQGRLPGATSSSSAATRTTAMDNRLALMCNNMRDRSVQVYTVRVEVTTGSNAVLRNCATNPATDFYEVTNAAGLSDAFQSIAGQITRLRIAH